MVSCVGIGMVASNVREDAILAMIEEPSPTSSWLHVHVTNAGHCIVIELIGSDLGK